MAIFGLLGDLIQGYSGHVKFIFEGGSFETLGVQLLSSATIWVVGLLGWRNTPKSRNHCSESQEVWNTGFE